MDANDIQKTLKKRTFIENNGRILRLLNILSSKEQTISSIKYLMTSSTEDELRTSLNYLEESGYIRIPHPGGIGGVEWDSYETGAIKVELTKHGMDLLMGITDNPAVEI